MKRTSRTSANLWAKKSWRFLLTLFPKIVYPVDPAFRDTEMISFCELNRLGRFLREHGVSTSLVILRNEGSSS